nr:MAG TPA: cytochrome b5 [Caudoviricetes sp.]
MGDLPSANSVWGAYLRSKGFVRRIVPDTCPDCYNVSDFAEEHPDGTYILALSGHVVCVSGGNWIDTWDSGGGVPLYYWCERKDES